MGQIDRRKVKKKEALPFGGASRRMVRRLTRPSQA
jgi:hypothetical protein